MGDVGYIPYSEIDAYCRLKGMFFPYERERFVKFVVALDVEWMKLHAEEQKKKNGKTGAQPPPPSHSPPRNVPHRSTTTRV